MYTLFNGRQPVDNATINQQLDQLLNTILPAAAEKLGNTESYQFYKSLAQTLLLTTGANYVVAVHETICANLYNAIKTLRTNNAAMHQTINHHKAIAHASF